MGLFVLSSNRDVGAIGSVTFRLASSTDCVSRSCFAMDATRYAVVLGVFKIRFMGD